MDELYICLSDAFQKAKINFMKVKKIRHVKVPGFVLHCEEKLPIAKYFLNLTESCLKRNKLIRLGHIKKLLVQRFNFSK